MRTNNKTDSHATPGPGIKPGPQQWEASTLTTVPSLPKIEIGGEIKIAIKGQKWLDLP